MRDVFSARDLPKGLVIGAQVYLAAIGIVTIVTALPWILDPNSSLSTYGDVVRSPREVVELRVAFGAQGLAAGLYMVLVLLRSTSGVSEGLRFLTVYLACVVPVRLFGALGNADDMSHSAVAIGADGTFLVISALLWWAVARRCARGSALA